MGCHIDSAPYRALKLTGPTAVTASGPAPTEESWATRARVKLTYPGTEYTAGPAIDVWWYDGGEKPPDEILEQVGDYMPQQGSIFVCSDGLIVIPHLVMEPFVLKDGKMAAAPPNDIEDRNHYHEFVDVVLGGGKQPCSASFDYAGPLTESVLIGNVAAHFPGETLAFDAQKLAFPGRPEANQYLTRSYRDGWRVKT
jgi:hypothetical protein